MRMITALTAIAISLTACGAPPSDAAATDDATSAPSPAPVEGAAASTAAPASREDVIAALRCHAVLSSAMASRIVVEGDGGAVAGIREQTRWFAEAQRRSQSAGLTEAEFDVLMAETRAPMITEEQRAENTPLLQECLSTVPDL